MGDVQGGVVEEEADEEEEEAAAEEAAQSMLDAGSPIMNGRQRQKKRRMQ
jgi:hypothetical protein